MDGLLFSHGATIAAFLAMVGFVALLLVGAIVLAAIEVAVTKLLDSDWINFKRKRQ